MESGTAPPCRSSWPELSSSSVINPSCPFSDSAAHPELPSQRGQPDSPSTAPHVPIPESPSSHQSLLLRELGNSQTLLLLPELRAGMAVSHSLETCRDAASVRLYQIPSSPAKPIGSVGNGADEPMCHLLPGPSALAANAESRLHG